MNEDIKQRWVAALRSGEYSQTREVLKDSCGYCCLGVLTDLWEKETGLSSHNMSDEETDEDLDDEVSEWAELYSCNPFVKMESGKYAALSELNDGILNKLYSFAELADLIEAQL